MFWLLMISAYVTSRLSRFLPLLSFFPPHQTQAGVGEGLGGDTADPGQPKACSTPGKITLISLIPASPPFLHLLNLLDLDPSVFSLGEQATAWCLAGNSESTTRPPVNDVCDHNTTCRAKLIALLCRQYYINHQQKLKLQEALLSYFPFPLLLGNCI